MPRDDSWERANFFASPHMAMQETEIHRSSLALPSRGGLGGDGVARALNSLSLAKEG
jgi:hypothetical protein